MATPETRQDPDSGRAPPGQAGSRALFAVYTRLVGGVRSSRWIHRQLFGYRPLHEPGCYGGAYWDWTTLTLARVLRRRLRPDHRFLDVGTGATAVLAIDAARRGCRRVVAVDVVPEVLEAAKRNCERLAPAIQLVVSDLFSNVVGSFDVIAFNAPYIGRAQGKELGVLPDSLSERRFCGGATGIETMARFLQEAPAHLAANGTLILGFNSFYVNDFDIRREAVKAALRIAEVSRTLPLPSRAFVLQPGMCEVGADPGGRSCDVVPVVS